MGNKKVILSIKPKYAEAILTGEKTVELRRRHLNLHQGDQVALYASHPVKAIIGSFTVKKVVTEKTADLYDMIKTTACISSDEFRLYFSGADTGCAIFIQGFTSISEKIPLEALGLKAPQSYRYVDDTIWTEIESKLIRKQSEIV